MNTQSSKHIYDNELINAYYFQIANSHKIVIYETYTPDTDNLALVNAFITTILQLYLFVNKAKRGSERPIAV